MRSPLKKENEKLAAKTDSYVLETNVHFPTDLNLLWDAARKGCGANAINGPGRDD